jgi:hypothetical protein
LYPCLENSTTGNAILGIECGIKKLLKIRYKTQISADKNGTKIKIIL